MSELEEVKAKLERIQHQAWLYHGHMEENADIIRALEERISHMSSDCDKLREGYTGELVPALKEYLSTLSAVGRIDFIADIFKAEGYCLQCGHVDCKVHCPIYWRIK